MNKYLIKSAFLAGLGSKLLSLGRGLFTESEAAIHGVSHVAINNMSRPKDMGDPARVAPIVEPVTKLAQEGTVGNKYLAKIESKQVSYREAKSGRFSHSSNVGQAKE